GQVAELHRVEQDAGGGGALHQRGHEALLALHPAQVGRRVDVPGPDVLQGLAAVQGVPAGGEVEPGVGVLEALVGADLHTADDIDGLHEAGEVQLQVVVDLHPGHLLDRAHGQLRTALGV